MLFITLCPVVIVIPTYHTMQKHIQYIIRTTFIIITITIFIIILLFIIFNYHHHYYNSRIIINQAASREKQPTSIKRTKH